MGIGDTIKLSSSTRITIGDALNTLEKGAQAFGGTTAGTAGAYTLTYPASPGPLVNGQIFTFRAHATCSYGPTLNVNGLGAFPILSPSGEQVAANEIRSGQVLQVIYYASTYFVIGSNREFRRFLGSSASLVSTTSGTPVNLPDAAFSITVEANRETLLIMTMYAAFYHSDVGRRMNFGLNKDGFTEKIHGTASTGVGGVYTHTFEHNLAVIFSAGVHTLQGTYWSPDGGTLYSSARYWNYVEIRIK